MDGGAREQGEGCEEIIKSSYHRPGVLTYQGHPSDYQRPLAFAPPFAMTPL